MIGNTTVVCEPQVKNLGVIFDLVMSMRQHVNYTSRTAQFHLRNISRTRRYIPEESCKLVVQSLVTSRLDYSNGLLYGIPKSAVSILQPVQNAAACIVTKTAPYAVPIVAKHWDRPPNIFGETSEYVPCGAIYWHRLANMCG